MLKPFLEKATLRFHLCLASLANANTNDPVEVGLADLLQYSALSHMAKPTLDAYVSTWNTFFLCGIFDKPRRFFSAANLAITL